MGDKAVRWVEGNTVVSESLPSIRLEVAPAMTYVGRLQFPLYGLAEVDLFVFAKANREHSIINWLVVQFEGYLEGNSHSYDYPSQVEVTLGEHCYQTDEFTAYLPISHSKRPDSDGARVAALLRERGYVVPEEIAWARFVRVLDEARRKELLFIYSEDLAQFSDTAAGLTVHGPLPPERDALRRSLHEHALHAFTVVEG